MTFTEKEFGLPFDMILRDVFPIALLMAAINGSLVTLWFLVDAKAFFGSIPPWFVVLVVAIYTAVVYGMVATSKIGMIRQKALTQRREEASQELSEENERLSTLLRIEQDLNQSLHSIIQSRDGQLSMGSGFLVLLLRGVIAKLQEDENASYGLRAYSPISEVPPYAPTDSRGIPVEHFIADLPTGDQLVVPLAPWMLPRLGPLPAYTGERKVFIDAVALDVLEAYTNWTLKGKKNAQG